MGKIIKLTFWICPLLFGLSSLPLCQPFLHREASTQGAVVLIFVDTVPMLFCFGLATLGAVKPLLLHRAFHKVTRLPGLLQLFCPLLPLVVGGWLNTWRDGTFAGGGDGTSRRGRGRHRWVQGRGRRARHWCVRGSRGRASRARDGMKGRGGWARLRCVRGSQGRDSRRGGRARYCCTKGRGGWARLPCVRGR